MSQDNTEMSFTDFLSELDRGRVAEELGETLLAVIEGVRQTGKAGHVTLKIGTGWDRKADMLRVSTNVTSKVPKLDRAESLFFVTNDGTPTRKDPRQYELELENKRRQDTAAAHVVDFSAPRHNTN